MKRYLFTIISLLCIVTLNAQTISGLEDFYREFKSNRFKTGADLVKPDIQGSPYENSEFIAGIVMTKSDIRYVDIPLRFNIYQNEIEFRSADGAKLALAAPEITEFVTIGNDKYIYVPYTISGRMQRGFFKVKTEGRASLLVRQKINLKEAEPAGAYKDAAPPRFIKMPDEYYIRIAPEEAKKVSNKKEFDTALPDKTKELEAYQKGNKLKLNRIDDLEKLVIFYNSLQENQQ